MSADTAVPDAPADTVLEVKDLSVSFAGRSGAIEAVRRLSLSIKSGEVLALVGESGSGKSVTASSVVGLLPRTRDVRVTGSITVEGQEVLGLSDRELNRIRGKRVGTIFQNPASSLDPSFKVGKQVVELVRHHRKVATVDARSIAGDWLERVGISDPRRVLSSYPHELSGGMKQRVMIAIALIPSPALLIADEPTTALDPTIQRQVLDLLASLQKELNIAILLVTHDFGVVSHLADRVAVLRRGQLVELADTDDVLTAPQDDYTRMLIDSVVVLDGHSNVAAPTTAAGDEPVIDARDISKHFTIRTASLRKIDFTALDHVDLQIRRGESVGLIGESGSGKSTLARIVAGLLPPSHGRVDFEGADIAAVSKTGRTDLRRRLQIVFQDHGGALNPRLRIGSQLVRPIVRLGVEASPAKARTRAVEVLELVGLDESFLKRYPHQLSGGQRQRIGVARALGVNPEVLILDEPTSALDVSTQAQVLDLLGDLKQRLDLSFVLISHNLAVVELFADRVIVLKAGRVVDAFRADEFLAPERDEVTKDLVKSVLPLRARPLTRTA